jgi:hypothetical protein
VTVHLKLSGFYEMIQPGEYGNEGKSTAGSSEELTGFRFG